MVTPMRAHPVTGTGSVREISAETPLASDEHVVLARSLAEARELAAAHFARVAPTLTADPEGGQEDDGSQ